MTYFLPFILPRFSRPRRLLARARFVRILPNHHYSVPNTADGGPRPDLASTGGSTLSSRSAPRLAGSGSPNSPRSYRCHDWPGYGCRHSLGHPGSLYPAPGHDDRLPGRALVLLSLVSMVGSHLIKCDGAGAVSTITMAAVAGAQCTAVEARLARGGTRNTCILFETILFALIGRFNVHRSIG